MNSAASSRTRARLSGMRGFYNGRKNCHRDTEKKLAETLRWVWATRGSGANSQSTLRDFARFVRDLPGTAVDTATFVQGYIQSLLRGLGKFEIHSAARSRRGA